MPLRAHIFVVVLACLMLVSILRLVRTKKLKAKYSLLWLSLGGVLLSLAVLPGRFLDGIGSQLGVEYQPTLYLVLGLAFLLAMVVHISFELSRLEHRVRTLAEEVTLLRREVELASPDPRPIENSTISVQTTPVGPAVVADGAAR
jgi:hypothetical protein